MFCPKCGNPMLYIEIEGQDYDDEELEVYERWHCGSCNANLRESTLYNLTFVRKTFQVVKERN